MYRVSLKHHKHKSTKASAAEHAAYILRDRETPETKAYVEYVLRQSRKTQEYEDLAHAEWHYLPAWADDNPVKFFLIAEQEEGANRRVSSSLEVALPRELSRDAQIALMQDYCASQFAGHAYLVGLHDSVGASGELNPHFHVTWSERFAEGPERSEKDFFRRPPYGAGKDPLYHAPGWLTATRQAWSDLANVSLERAGIEGAYVDPRSLRHRGIEREPEQRLSPDHTTKAKLGKEITPKWQAVLDGRKQREALRALEQAIATDAWKVRKEELGINNVHSLDRERFVQQIARQTREQALTPRRTQAQVQRLAAQLQHSISTTETFLRQVQVEHRVERTYAAQGRVRPRSGQERVEQLLAQGRELGIDVESDASAPRIRERLRGRHQRPRGAAQQVNRTIAQIEQEAAQGAGVQVRIREKDRETGRDDYGW